MRIKKIGTVLVKVKENFMFMKDLKMDKHISEKRLYTIKDGNKRYLVKSKY